MAYFNTTNTTTFPSIIGEKPIVGTGLGEGKKSATIADDEVVEGTNDLFTRNVKYIQEREDLLDKDAFEIIHAAQLNLLGGTFSLGDKKITFNTYDDWSAIPSSSKEMLLKHYKDAMTNAKNAAIYNDLNLASDDKISVFDAINSYYNLVERESEVTGLYKLHNEYQLSAAAAVDGQYRSKGYDQFNYAQAMFNPETKSLITKNEYDKVVNTRYNKLVTQSYIYDLSPTIYRYAQDLYSNNKSSAIIRDKNFENFNNILYSQYAKSQTEGGTEEEKFTRFVNNLFTTNEFSLNDPSYVVNTLWKGVIPRFQNVQGIYTYGADIDPSRTKVAIGQPVSQQETTWRSASNKLFNQFLISNGWTRNDDKLLQEKRSLEGLIKSNEQKAKDLSESNANPQSYVAIGQSSERAQKRIKEINYSLQPDAPIVSYEDFWNKLTEGKEEQNYEKTLIDIRTMYNKNQGYDIKSLKDRYQFMIDAGGGGVYQSWGIDYKFNFQEDLRNTIKDGSNNANYKAANSFFLNLDKLKTNNPEVLTDNFLVSIDVDAIQGVVSFNKSSVDKLDNQTNESKYITSVLIPQLSSILKNPSNKEKIAAKEAYDAGRTTIVPESLSETDRRKIPKGDFIYRGDVSGEGMEDYEAYSFRFDPIFLNEYEADLKKIYFKTSDDDDEESTNKIVNDIFQRVRDNGITFFVKRDFSNNPENKGFRPSIERKNALQISSTEAVIYDRGYIVRRYPRAGTVKVFKDEKANVWRISGNYLKLNTKGEYNSIPIKEETFPIKEQNGTIATPYDIEKIINNYVERLKYDYNANTKKLKYLIELGVQLKDDAYFRSE